MLHLEMHDSFVPLVEFFGSGRLDEIAESTFVGCCLLVLYAIYSTE